MTVTRHFRERVRERIGGDVCPDALGSAILLAIEQDRTDFVQFISRVNRRGERYFLFQVPDGRPYVALVDTEAQTLITVVAATPGSLLMREGKPPVEF